MSLAAGLGHKQEVYSIDESFAHVSGIRGDITERSRKVRQRILQWIGIPCGISATLLPIALQLTSRATSQPHLLSAAAAFQAETDFHLRRPPV